MVQIEKKRKEIVGETNKYGRVRGVQQRRIETNRGHRPEIYGGLKEETVMKAYLKDQMDAVKRLQLQARVAGARLAKNDETHK